ncbi:MAG: SelT/SelW/SelH family protein [Gemmatimonadetes bacterium]|nr:SelT/SelW/SelH family protein [Gemmatimonadota bacterium]
MEAELLARFPGISVELIESGGGVFEVTCDGELVYSKRATGRHALPGEVVSRIAGR